MNERYDEELIREIQSGNILAFESLVKKYQERLLNFTHRIVKDEAAADDVVQDTFIKVYKAIDRIDRSKKFSSYLFQIAKNTGISYMRKKKPTFPIGDEVFVSEQESPEENFEKTEKKIVLKKAIDKLEGKYKKIIMLYYFHELSYREIAKKLRMPMGTVKTNLLRAKEALKENLKNEGI